MATMLARTLTKGIQLQTSFGEELLAIEGDAAQLSHALVNLCINAGDAMNGEGVLTIGAHVQTLDADAARAREVAAGAHVVLSVRDTRSGMTEATRQRLFEPFFAVTTAAHGREGLDVLVRERGDFDCSSTWRCR